MIDRDHKKLSVRQQCELVEVHRSNLYYQPKPKVDDSILMNKIHELWLKRPIYGYRRITQILKREGSRVNYKRILRLMREMNLQALYPKKNLSRPGANHKIYPYLLKELNIDRPNQVWASDITYIKLPQGVVYLVALIDLYSRYIVAWELSNCIDRTFCMVMLEKAFKKGTPEIVNTDQGAQFTSQEWISRLEQEGIRISMDGVGRCMDNIYIERFWRTLKYEDMHLMAYEDMRDAHEKISDYINFYNSERLHSSLGYKTPTEVYERREHVITNCKKIFKQKPKEQPLGCLSF